MVAKAAPRVDPDVSTWAIDGLDTEVGLVRAAGKKPLYVKLLVKFGAGQGRAAEEIRQALDGDDWQLAARIAHTLKGSAGTLGALTVEVLAIEVENRIKARAARVDIDEALARLEPVLTGLASALARVSAAAAP
jgi:HPt (histidine-containing phosphotransfer) domain-containing protein